MKSFPVVNAKNGVLKSKPWCTASCSLKMGKKLQSISLKAILYNYGRIMGHFAPETFELMLVITRLLVATQPNIS